MVRHACIRRDSSNDGDRSRGPVPPAVRCQNLIPLFDVHLCFASRPIKQLIGLDQKQKRECLVYHKDRGKRCVIGTFTASIICVAAATTTLQNQTMNAQSRSCLTAANLQSGMYFHSGHGRPLWNQRPNVAVLFVSLHPSGCFT